MNKKEMVATGLTVLLSAASILEGTQPKWYRKPPPHTHNELPATEMFSDSVQAANGTVDQQTLTAYGSLPGLR